MTMELTHHWDVDYLQNDFFKVQTSNEKKGTKKKIIENKMKLKNRVVHRA